MPVDEHGNAGSARRDVRFYAMVHGLLQALGSPMSMIVPSGEATSMSHPWHAMPASLLAGRRGRMTLHRTRHASHDPAVACCISYCERCWLIACILLILP